MQMNIEEDDDVRELLTRRPGSVFCCRFLTRLSNCFNLFTAVGFLNCYHFLLIICSLLDLIPKLTTQQFQDPIGKECAIQINYCYYILL